MSVKAVSSGIIHKLCQSFINHFVYKPRETACQISMSCVQPTQKLWLFKCIYLFIFLKANMKTVNCWIHWIRGDFFKIIIHFDYFVRWGCSIIMMFFKAYCMFHSNWRDLFFFFYIKTSPSKTFFFGLAHSLYSKNQHDDISVSFIL